jgi:formylglycine-generating enzyme required for sulfatase activity
MADVFVSYAREDKLQVRPVVDLLRTNSLSVFWDEDLPPDNYRHVLEQELKIAKCALVLWSQHSVVPGSFVISEASRAQKYGIYFPALIDINVDLPLGLDETHAIDLSGHLTSDKARMNRLLSEINRRLVRLHTEVKIPQRTAMEWAKVAKPTLTSFGWLAALVTPSRKQKVTEAIANAIPAAGTVFRDREELWCPRIVVVPKGNFLMGSPKDEIGRDDSERTPEIVDIPGEFGIGCHAVRRLEFEAFVKDTKRIMVGGLYRPIPGGWMLDPGLSFQSPGFSQNGKHPVVGVSWEDALQYCEWLSSKTKYKYRLPTEVEWEYCARARTRTPFWFGPDISTDVANYDGTHIYVRQKKGKFRQSTVSTEDAGFPANNFGLCHVHGNVWEWCIDRWSLETGPNDTKFDTLSDASGEKRPARGGSWYSRPNLLRAACRRAFEAHRRFNIVGFRVVRLLS